MLPIQQVRGLFDDPEVVVLAAPVSESAVASLTPREAAAIPKAREKRRREYASGRALARDGLERFFGLREFDLLNAEDRAPIWPKGIAGSLSHCDTRAWVALVDRRRGTVGIDGEHRTELKRDLWHLTMLDAEIEALEATDEAIRGQRALVMFSAKEALYKAQYPRSREFMGFMALHVAVEEDELICTFQKAVGPYPKGFVARGRWCITEAGEVLTGVQIRGT